MTTTSPSFLGGISSCPASQGQLSGGLVPASWVSSFLVPTFWFPQLLGAFRAHFWLHTGQLSGSISFWGTVLATIPALWVNPAFRHRFCQFIFLDPAFWDFQLSGTALVESSFGPSFLGNPAFWSHLLISTFRSKLLFLVARNKSETWQDSKSQKEARKMTVPER